MVYEVSFKVTRCRYSLSLYSVFSLTWPASMQLYWNKRKRLHKKRVQLPQDWFGTQTWPPWRHVKSHNIVIQNSLPELLGLNNDKRLTAALGHQLMRATKNFTGPVNRPLLTLFQQVNTETRPDLRHRPSWFATLRGADEAAGRFWNLRETLEKFWRHPLAEKFWDTFANIFFVWDLLINKKLGIFGN